MALSVGQMLQARLTTPLSSILQIMVNDVIYYLCERQLCGKRKLLKSDIIKKRRYKDIVAVLRNIFCPKYTILNAVASCDESIVNCQECSPLPYLTRFLTFSSKTTNGCFASIIRKISKTLFREDRKSPVVCHYRKRLTG